MLNKCSFTFVSAGSCTSHASTVNTDYWLSLVPDVRTGPGVALALESSVETNLQTLLSPRRSAKPWPGEKGPPKPGGHPREDRGRPCTPALRDRFPRPKAAGPPGWFGLRPSRRVSWLPEETRRRPGRSSPASAVGVPAPRGASAVMSRGGAPGPGRLDATGDAAVGAASPALEVRWRPAGRAQGRPGRSPARGGCPAWGPRVRTLCVWGAWVGQAACPRLGSGLGLPAAASF